MATSTSITTAYEGEHKTEIYAKTILEGKTLSNGYVTIVDGIKRKTHMNKVEVSSYLQDDSCNWTPTGSIAQTQATLEPHEFKVELELCHKDFKMTYEYSLNAKGANNNTLPKSYGDFIVQRIGQNVSAEVDKIIWQGDTDSTAGGAFTKVDGFVKRMKEASDSVKVTASTSGVVKANVEAELEKVYAAIPELQLEKENLYFQITPAIASAYKRAQISQGINTSVGDKELDFLGVKLITNPFLPANHMIVYQASNFLVGTDLASDFNVIRVKDLDPDTFEPKFKYQLKGTLDTCILFPSEAVIYAPGI